MEKKEQTKLPSKNMHKERLVNNILNIYLLLNNDDSQQLNSMTQDSSMRVWKYLWNYDNDIVV